MGKVLRVPRVKSGIVTCTRFLRATISLSGDSKVLCIIVTRIAIFYKSSMVYRTVDFKTKLSYASVRKVNAMQFYRTLYFQV